MGELLRGAKLTILPHPLSENRDWQFWTEVVFVSICHQATWDRLHNRIIRVVSEDPSIIHPSKLAIISPADFDRLFAPGFDSERLRQVERLRILRKMGEQVQMWPSVDPSECFTKGLIHLEGSNGLYSWLDRFSVYAEDPLRKKARVLVHQLLHYGLIEVDDPQHIRAAVDYHIIRLYARTNRVMPAVPKAGGPLENGEEPHVKLLTHLRRAVEEAMAYTAAGAMIRIDELNHIEWQIARSFCTRKEARCHCGPLPEKPVDNIVALLSQARGGRCPYVDDCPAVSDTKLRLLVDPKSSKAFY